MRVGILPLRTNSKATCVDLTPFREAEGRDIEGSIGMPLFRSYIVQIDFDAHCLTILPAACEPTSSWGQPVEVSYNKGGVPMISLKIADRVEENIVVDTGSSTTLSLASKVYAKLVDRQLIAPLGETTFALINGFRSSQQGRVQKVTLGDVETRDLLVADGGKSSRVGLGYLRQFRVTFDIPHDRIFLAKGNNGPSKCLPSASVYYEKGSIRLLLALNRIHRASEPGILSGDKLLSVGGEPIAGKPVAEIRWMLCVKPTETGAYNLRFDAEALSGMRL